ncbi:uncharacterized protein DFL_009821 [Arthrobotrys flagrans]|uniref:DUF4097 domain-containing protein n=1 Tax=Arthrobotrys flagrans TaxID=97331 RepID=A0A436ZSR1_ARTFL|nr:hypothetical protein DFL_009821 [Arthrobotrys flagrans]
MERYTDEKLPETVYLIEEGVELQQPKPKRPLWRRCVRIFLTMAGIWMLFSAFAPVFRGGFGCHRHRRPHDIDVIPQPGPEMPQPNMDMDFTEDPTSKIPVQHYTFDPSLRNFYISQESFHKPSRVEVVGNLIVRSCDKASNISAHFKFEVSDSSLRKELVVQPARDGIVFKLDPFSPVSTGKVNATVFLVIPKKKDYRLDSLHVNTIQLPIWIKDSFTTSINSTSFTTVTGTITSFGKSSQKNALDINNLRLRTGSGKIAGEFPLNHALALETTNGDIVANVVSSDRPEKIGWLKTSSVNGNHKVRFISHLNPRPLYSKHKSVSGDISVVYPEDWQGGLKLKSTSGHIEVDGKGTKVVRKDKGLVGRFWKVIKGDGKSKGSITTVSGKIDVFIGEEDKEEGVME